MSELVCLTYISQFCIYLCDSTSYFSWYFDIGQISCYGLHERVQMLFSYLSKFCFLVVSELNIFGFFGLLSWYFQVREARWTKTKWSKVTGLEEICCLIAGVFIFLNSKTQLQNIARKFAPIIMDGSHWVVIPTTWEWQNFDTWVWLQLVYATIGINASDLYCRIRSSTITEKARIGQIIHMYVDSEDDKEEPVKEMVMVLKVCWLLIIDQGL